MSINNKKKTTGKNTRSENLHLSAIDDLLNEPEQKGITGFFRRHWIKGAVGFFALLLTFGVFAKKGWLPQTDPVSGKKTGWFGAELAKNAPSSWNLLSTAFATPTPLQMSKEYIYAGSRLLAVEDANASAIPPTDLAFWRPSTGGWHIYNSENLGEDPTVVFGQEGDIPILGDYDGDGKTDFAYYRPDEFGANNEWHIQRSSDGTAYTVGFSYVGMDKPVSGDFDGDGKTDLAAWKSTGGTSHPWTIQYSSTGTTITTSSFGSTGDKPVPADYDGDGKADLAVWHGATLTFTWKSSISGQVFDSDFASPATSSDTPVCADYDGDGKANFALNQGATWIIKFGESITSTTPWSGVTGVPVQNDYDGDGKVDIAVWYLYAKNLNDVPKGFWKILQSNDQTTRTDEFGMEGDIPVPAYYRRY